MSRIVYTLFFALLSTLAYTQTVVDIIVNSADHNTLEAAVIAAELNDDLSGPGPFTVFAPTDSAFSLLPAGVVDELLMDPTGDLAKILLYHVLGGEVLSSSLSDGQKATTLLGQDIEVTINTDGTFINGSKVSMVDINATNGVVHVLDAVLLPPAATVVDVVVNSPNHTTLEAAVVAAELADDLSGDGPFTVFAPTDAAFDLLPDGVVDELLIDPTGDLAKILLYHVLGGEVLSSDLSDGQMATTLLGQGIEVSIDNGVFINGAEVSVANIRTFNGVVHVIDAVLLPAATVVDVIVDSPDHTTLEAAVIAAELDDDLSGDGPFTVFAPTDAAFDLLPAGTVDALLMDPTGDLAQILLYHVLGAEVLSSDLTDGQTAATLQGQEIMVDLDNGVMINNAMVTVANIRTLNGVVHVINAVLLPDLTSTKDLLQVDLEVSPNPASEFVTINLPAAMSEERVEGSLVNMNGVSMKNWVFDGTQSTLSVDKMPAGTYILLLQSPTGFAREMIIID